MGKEINPFLYSLNRDNWIVTHDKKDVYFQYKHIWILCLKNDAEYNDDIVEKYTDVSSLIKNYTLVKSCVKFIMSENKISHVLTIKGDVLKKYFNYDFDEKELVFPMYNVHEDHIRSYCKQYDGSCSLYDYFAILSMNDFFNYPYLTALERVNRITILKSMYESKYWTLSSHCKQNITKMYILRLFSKRGIDDIKQIDDNNFLKTILEKDHKEEDYLALIYERQKYVDASTFSNKRLYYITKHPKLDTLGIDQFNKYIEIILNNNYYQEFYYLIVNTLISKELCNFILNNKYVLEVIQSKENKPKSFFEKYGILLKYVMSYAWLCMYMEESICKTKIKTSDRFIFDCDTASKLPFFPFNKHNPSSSPYLPLMIASDVLDPAFNLMGLDQAYYKNNNAFDDYGYGVCNLKEFKTRKNIFMFGKNVDLLQDLQWNGIGICGSIIAACAPNFNPLHLYYKNNEEVVFSEFFKEYYENADVDVICIGNQFQFIDKVHNIYDTLYKNILKEYKLEPASDIAYLVPIKTVVVFFDIDYAKNNLVTKDLTLEMIVEDANRDVIKEKVYKLYIEKKVMLAKDMINSPQWNNKKYTPYFEIVPLNKIKVMLSKVNPFKLNQNSDIIEYKGLHFAENIKYSIKSKYLARKLEVFKGRNQDIFGTVSQFHLPCVRGYYNGSTLYLTPSCISACMTFINLDYKYFAGTNDPIEIINKYRRRGFGTFLNQNEMAKMLEYSAYVPKWKELYGLNLKKQNTIKKCLGYKSYNDPFYVPKNKIVNPPHIAYDIHHLYFQKLNGNDDLLMSQECINSKGYVTPFKEWIVEYAYHTLK